MSAGAEVEAAQSKARSSSFYAGMRVLPKAERDAMFAIYAFCRAVDDIADEPGPSREERRQALDIWRAQLKALYDGGEPGQAAFLAGPVRAYDLDLDDFLTIVDGMQMDVEADIRGPSLADLDLYCERVASAVGRLSVRVFGMRREPGIELAHHLGRALQLTNILRDLDEDAGMGRLYLAREWLDAAGLDAADPAAAVADPRIDAAARPGARLAHQHYAKADAVLADRPGGRLAAPRLMSAVYGGILSKMEQVGWAPPRQRVKLGRGAMLAVALRSLILRA
ncbi:MAG TPA: presqualene diphosphate synthase HpnD [Caulobacteraceae bacterium]|nr:presqualene diphosphate synthase HpnD [Caulobacteraceae bacterium]